MLENFTAGLLARRQALLFLNSLVRHHCGKRWSI
jgi:hypothetical protein